MRFPIITTIFRKELREVLRDKRMVYLVILLPFFLYPVLFFIIGKLSASSDEKMDTEKVSVILNPEAEATPVYELLSQDTTLDVRLGNVDRAHIDTLAKTIGVVVPADYEQQLEAGGSTPIQILADQSKEVVEARVAVIKARLAGLNQQLLQQRLQASEIDPTFIEPIQIQTDNLATQESIVGRAAGSFLPLIILLFIFVGSIYIAIDISAGEKERKTLQTLFTAPVTTSEIIAGKFLAVSAVGITSALANISSLIASMFLQVSLMGVDTNKITLSLSGADIFWLVVLVLLSTIFIAALCLGIMLLANSYKEAQSYVSPLMMLVLLPGIAAQVPTIELDTTTALIPMLNISLGIGSIFKGDYSIALIGMVSGFALLYGFISLWIASKTFGNENVVNGEKVNLKQLFSFGTRS